MSIETFFDEVGDDLKTSFGAFLDTILGGGGRTLLSIVDTAVRAVEADPSLLTSDAKRTAAIESIMPALESAGITIVKSAISSAIEVAVAALRAELGPIGGVIGDLAEAGVAKVESAI